MNNGWILIHRKLKKKAWAGSPNFVALWVHLLINAAWKDTELMWNGSLIKLERGQLLTGRKALSTTSGISENIVRSILSRFELDQQITIKKTNKYSIISITNYDSYQVDSQQITNKSPTDHQQTTSQPPHIKEALNNNKEKKGRFTPPTLEEVTSYCNERQNGIDPQHFIDHYAANGWVRGKTKIKCWKACVRTWEKSNGKTSKQTASDGRTALERWEEKLNAGKLG